MDSNSDPRNPDNNGSNETSRNTIARGIEQVDPDNNRIYSYVNQDGDLISYDSSNGIVTNLGPQDNGNNETSGENDYDPSTSDYYFRDKKDNVYFHDGTDNSVSRVEGRGTIITTSDGSQWYCPDGCFGGPEASDSGNTDTSGNAQGYPDNNGPFSPNDHYIDQYGNLITQNADGSLTNTGPYKNGGYETNDNTDTAGNAGTNGTNQTRDNIGTSGNDQGYPYNSVPLSPHDFHIDQNGNLINHNADGSRTNMGPYYKGSDSDSDTSGNDQGDPHNNGSY